MSRRHLEHLAGKLSAILAVAALLLLSGALHAVPGPASDRALGAAVPPTVTSVSPVDGAEDRSIHQVFTVSFDQDMDPATLTSLDLFIFEAGGFPLPATVTYDAATRTATLTPQEVLEAGSTYYVTLNSNVKSADGLSVVGAPLTWHFHTVLAVAPHITGLTPADGSAERPLSQTMSIGFDTEMDVLSFTSTSFYFAKRDDPYTTLPAAISYDPETMTATLTPAEELEEATTYDVSVTSKVRGSTGLFVVGTPIVWSFTTILVQPPAVTGFSPADGAQDQPYDTVVTISFDRDMDPGTVNATSFYLQAVGGQPVPVDRSTAGKVLTLRPVVDLEPDTTYQVTVTEAVKNVKGASIIGAPITWTFKTKQLPSPFSDLLHSNPYFYAIYQLALRDIVAGFEDGTFRSQTLVTRQQFAKMIVRTLGYPVSTTSICPFTDVTRTGINLVDPDDPFYPDHYVAAAAAHGIIQGKTATIFAPYENISRYQAVTMAVRAVNDIDSSRLSTPPATYQSTWNPNLSAVHGQNARLAEFNGLLAQLPLATSDPFGPMTRGEIAQLLWNLITKLQL